MFDETTEESTGCEIFTGSSAKVMELSLVLASQSLPHQIGFYNNIYHLTVELEIETQSRQLIDRYIAENKSWRAEINQTEDISLSTLPFLFLLAPVLLFFFQVHPFFNNHLITLLGRCDAIKILSGEWWRVFTGLTLHSGSQHFLSNLLAGYFIFNLVVHKINPGLSLLGTILLSGIANLAVALTISGGHLSIGFSTAVFAGLGILSGSQSLAYFIHKMDGIKSWTPVISGFFIVVLMGLAEGSDILAHVYGFVFGLFGGFTLPFLNTKTKPLWIQNLLVLASGSIFGLSWFLALN
ncbi:MAG: rhomboid family intramembrane serine protease [Fibrobacteria bacterium]|nr:rhomboid family intramembrane serine protease [Fibrobacteria bacterium]